MPTATAPKPAARIRIQIDLPDEVVAYYERQATSERSAESLIAQRLIDCRDHTAQRGIYLNDDHRREIEAILGGALLANGAELVRQLTRFYTVQIGGANVRLPEQVYLRLDSLARDTGTPMRDMIVDICQNALDQYVNGGI